MTFGRLMERHEPELRIALGNVQASCLLPASMISLNLGTGLLDDCSAGLFLLSRLNFVLGAVPRAVLVSLPAFL